MTRPNITPGPWEEEFPAHGFYDPIGSNGDRVCFIHHGINNTNANARAIAAVPALLNALETIHANAAESPEWIRRHTIAALTAAGYQF